MRFLLVGMASLLAGCSSARVGSGSAARETAPAAFLTDTRSWVMTSSASHRTYQISVALPDGYDGHHPAYPVLYAADANTEFGALVETARLLAFEHDIPGLVIVGIGYPNAGQGFKASWNPRTLDLTPTPDPPWLKEDAKESRALGVPPAEATGGAPEFLAFLRNELVPSIERSYAVSPQDRAWFGHSFGGLFGAYALLHNDGLFGRFVIGSPSLWWNDRVLFSMEESFAASGKALPVRAFFSVGLLEEQMDPRYQMVTNLRAFVQRLEQRRYRGLALQAHYFDEETHASVVPATISRGLRFVYSR
jgi:predicted alpha/beta superfamily hydrolase